MDVARSEIEYSNRVSGAISLPDELSSGDVMSSREDNDGDAIMATRMNYRTPQVGIPLLCISCRPHDRGI